MTTEQLCDWIVEDAEGDRHTIVGAAINMSAADECIWFNRGGALVAVFFGALSAKRLEPEPDIVEG